MLSLKLPFYTRSAGPFGLSWRKGGGGKSFIFLFNNEEGFMRQLFKSPQNHLAWVRMLLRVIIKPSKAYPSRDTDTYCVWITRNYLRDSACPRGRMKPSQCFYLELVVLCFICDVAVVLNPAFQNCLSWDGAYDPEISRHLTMGSPEQRVMVAAGSSSLFAVF